MSDESQRVKKCEIALTLATISSTDIEIDRAVERVRLIKKQLLINKNVLVALSSLSRRARKQVWTYHRDGQWFQKILPNLGEQCYRQSFRVSEMTFKYIVDAC